MTTIRTNSVFSVFPLVRAALVANSTLSTKFPVEKILEYEPKHKSTNFVGFPYIWVVFPRSDESKLTTNGSLYESEVSCALLLRIEWDARSKGREYCNAIMEAITDYEDTFQSSGYYDVHVDLINSDSNFIINQKQILQFEFELTWKAMVRR